MKDTGSAALQHTITRDLVTGTDAALAMDAFPGIIGQVRIGIKQGHLLLDL